ncbi:hypothetical protein DXW43_06930 [Salmonella enterica]|nr:hypothetical protein [Salmonella enterica]EDE9382009.1 hypothetical protein [Salmonella enterica subsp. enterica serovar Enteritidis]EAU1634934.1 hypothetical protein [Salmonella enterica]EAW6170259.1 hypothetical protein [Salmonella enterica]EBG9200258.1 hypothetical protein [Salmonella enterica]
MAHVLCAACRRVLSYLITDSHQAYA